VQNTISINLLNGLDAIIIHVIQNIYHFVFFFWAVCAVD